MLNILRYTKRICSSAGAKVLVRHLETCDASPGAIRLSAIVCTLGPASSSVEMLERMMESGMTIARLNFSYGTHKSHAAIIENLRQATQNFSAKIGREWPLAIGLDTKGPGVRTGAIESDTGEVLLEKGATIELTIVPDFQQKGNKERIFVDYLLILNVVQPGDQLFIGGGEISLEVKEITKDSVICQIVNGGMLGSHKGVNLPRPPIGLPALSDKDIHDIRFGVDKEMDVLFVSFVRDAASLKDVRSVLGEKGKSIKIVAKIETEEGLENLDEIIAAADGIMVGRGDLGAELPLEKLFVAQKVIIAQCNAAGKPVIVASHMLESMMHRPRPTRAEITDIANAILDGADCVMLSNETAAGEYPLECITTMSNTIKEAEAALEKENLFADLARIAEPIIVTAPRAVAFSAFEAAGIAKATAIIVLTTTGRPAYLLSMCRPPCPILAVTRFPQVARHANLYRGMIPLIFKEPPLPDWLQDVDVRVKFGLDFGKENGFVKVGDKVVVVSSWLRGGSPSSTIRVVVVE